jgi:hypothetical protein
MSILLICIFIFIVFMAAGYAGLLVQARLTEAHKTGESKGVVGQCRGWSACCWRWFWER